MSVHAGMPAYDRDNANNMLADNDVRAQIVQAMARAFNVPGQDGTTGLLNVSTIKTHNDMIRVIGRNVWASGPLGWARQPNGSRGLTGDRFGISYQQRPWSATTLWNASGTSANYFAARRGMNNAIQGVHIDDIIIGFAERGEMVTGATTGATTFVDNNRQLQPSSPTDTGSYQMEIRRGASYLDFDTFDAGDRPFHSRSFDTNARLAQQVTLIAPSGSEIADGQTFTVSDGINTLTFEYEDRALPPGNPNRGVTPGQVEVGFLTAMHDYEIAAAIRNAINSAAAQNVLQIRAGLSDGSGSGSTSNRVNLYGNTMADRHGSQDFDINRVIYGLDVPDQFDLGDQNIHREQGQLVIHSNMVSHAQTWGIIIDAGVRGSTLYGDLVPLAGNALPHPGSIRNLRTPNNQRLAPGAVVSNNTVYGNRAGDVGIRVQNNAGPTLLNNAVANLGTGVSVDGSSQSTTVVGATLYWNNANNAPSGVGDFAIVAPVGVSPFVDAAAGNFYPAPNSLLIDSSVPWLADRTTFVDVKTPHGLGVLNPATGRYSSRIVAPTTDVHGQLRVDDPNVDTPPSQAVNSIIDRGAVDRADWFQPTAQLLSPLDNDAAGRDRDPNPTVVNILENQLPYFAILLSDGNGVGLDPTTVTSANLSVTQDRSPLTEGIDYTFGYNPVNNQLLLTPLSQIWEPNSVYQITLDNNFIRDRARNRLTSNQPDGKTMFTIILGDLPLDYGDAPNSFGTWLANNGARHLLLPQMPFLGTRVTPSSEGQTFDIGPIDVTDPDEPSDNDGVQLEYLTPSGFVRQSVLNSRQIATPITVNVGRAGWLDGWIDFNGNGTFDAIERLHFYDTELDAAAGGHVTGRSRWLEAGEHTLWVVTPTWTVILPEGIDRYARFRIRPDETNFSPTAPFQPTGLVLGGEVEDYKVSIVGGRPPVAVNDNFWIFEDPAQVSEDEIPVRYRLVQDPNPTDPDQITLTPDVLRNDTDPDGDDVVKVLLVDGPQHASQFTLNEDGTFEYYPVQDFNGTDTFTYRAIDELGVVSNNVATVMIHVQPKNDPPTLSLAKLSRSIHEDDPAGLAFDGIITLGDLDDLLAPGVELQVTLDVLHGGLQIDTTSLQVIGSPVMADDDGIYPAVLDDDPTLELYQTVTLQGTIVDWNAALNDMRYFGDADFNTDTLDERLVIQTWIIATTLPILTARTR